MVNKKPINISQLGHYQSANSTAKPFNITIDHDGYLFAVSEGYVAPKCKVNNTDVSPILTATSTQYNYSYLFEVKNGDTAVVTFQASGDKQSSYLYLIYLY